MKAKLLFGLLVLVLAFSSAIVFRVHSDSSPPPSPSAYLSLYALAQNNALASSSVYNKLQPEEPIILCFFCDCPNCRHTAQRLASLAHQHNPNIVGVFSIGPEDARNFVRETRFPGTPLLDVNSSVAQQYGVTDCPRVFVLNDSKVVYSNPHGGQEMSRQEWKRITPYLVNTEK